MHPFRSLPCLLVVVLAGSAGSAAPEVPGGERPRVVAAESGGEHGGHEHGGHEGSQAQAPEPGAATAAWAWAELRGLQNAIAADVKAGRLGEIHAKSERLIPLAHALLRASKDLAPENRARVESAVKQLVQVAGGLHEAADGGNAEATRRELKRLDSLLELIRAQYPPDALSSATPATKGHDHAMHEHAHGASAAPGHAHAERPLAAVEAPPDATVLVRAGEFAFEPRRLELQVGQPTRIELQNDGAVEHSLIVRTPDGTGDWIHLHAAAHGSDAGTFRLDRAGTYPLLCTVPGHTEAGMVGTLVVVDR